MEVAAERMEAEWYASSAPADIERDEDAILQAKLRKLVLLVDAATRGLVA